MSTQAQGQSRAEGEMADWYDVRGRRGSHGPNGVAGNPATPLHEEACVIEVCLTLESDNTQVQFLAEALSCCVILSYLASLNLFLHLGKMGKRIPTSLSRCEASMRPCV